MHPKCCLGHTYTTKLFIVYLKFKFNWASCILSGSPNSSPYCCDIAVYFLCWSSHLHQWISPVSALPSASGHFCLDDIFSIFFFFNIYIFVFGCARSSLLRVSCP